MKVYVIRPTLDVFDGTGTLSPEAARALDLIARMVADSLRAGGDDSHQAAVSDGPTEVGTPPSLVSATDRESIVALARRMLDPNGMFGGDVRSATNCRTATFGHDGQAFLCLRHEDEAPVPLDPALITVTEQSDLLAQTDLFDGGWPTA